MKTYANRQWKQNRTNTFGYPIYELHFTEFYEDKVILMFAQDDEELERFNYVSELLSVEDDFVICDSAEEAKGEFEDMVVNHIEEEIASLEEMLTKFNELN